MLMVDTIVIVLVSFISGAIFFELAKRYVKRPKGYIRLKHHGSGDVDLTDRRTRRSTESTPSIRSKYDSLFDYASKNNVRKVDLESVEKSFQPDPRPQSYPVQNKLQNRYLDLSHITSSDADSHASSYSSPAAQPKQYPSQQYSSYSQMQTPSPQTAPNPSTYSQPTQTTGYAAPQSPVQTQTPAFQTPSVEPQKPKTEEKEHEWKPMGFFDD